MDAGAMRELKSKAGDVRRIAEAQVLQGLSSAEVAERGRVQVPGARTTPKCVVRYAAKMRKRGVEVPKRERSK